MSSTLALRTPSCSWHTVTVIASALDREVARLRSQGAVITGSRRTADSFVLTYVV